MPRRHRAARERSSPLVAERPRTAAPAWAHRAGFDVRTVSGDKTYRCPGCDLEIRSGVEHLVVIRDGVAAERRHWHSVCWRQEVRRTQR